MTLTHVNTHIENAFRFILFSSFSLLLIACSPSNSRLASDAQEVIWNDTDAQLVAEKMINELLADNWHNNHVRNSYTKVEPSIAVGVVRDLSREQLDMHTFSGNLERKLLLTNSANLYVLAKGDQQARNEWLKKTHADYILNGSINRIADDLSGVNARFYQVDLVLIERATKQKAWQGQTKIRKSPNRHRVKSVASNF